MFTKANEAKDKRAEAVAELDRLQTRKVELEAQVANLSTDRGIEGELRQRFMVAKGGEHVVVIPDTVPNENESGTIDLDPSLWKKFLGLFKQ